MKCRLAKLVVFLVLGAVVNVAVAWTCVATVPIALRPGEVTIRKVTADYQQVQCIQRAFGRTRESWGEEYALPVVIDYYERLFAFGGGGASWERTGWPMRALFCSISANQVIRTIHGNETLMAGSDGQIDQGIELSPELLNVPGSSFATWRALPYRPIWPGFAINTAFYAALLWLPICGPFTLRRLSRRRRGHCIKCGYDLRGAEHEVCPECGWRREVTCAHARTMRTPTSSGFHSIT